MRPLLLAAVVLLGCGEPHRAPTSLPAARPDPLAGATIMRRVTALTDDAMAGRAAGSPGEQAAAAFVAEELRQIGLEPARQEVPLAGGRSSVNVHALVRGRGERTIVIGAHLDHLGRAEGVLYPGADDDASGVAVVLGLAEALAARRAELGCSVLVVFFGAEEVGLVGSAFFAANPPLPIDQVRLMINIDPVGRPLMDAPIFSAPLALLGVDRARTLGVVGTRGRPALRRLLDESFAAEGAKVLAAEDLPAMIGREIERQAAYRGDSASFDARGVPTLFFGSGQSADYHLPTDTADRLDPTILERRARALLRFVLAFSVAPTTP
jgi:hypothetical protein